jgi:hypothetical protein
VEAQPDFVPGHFPFPLVDVGALQLHLGALPADQVLTLVGQSVPFVGEPFAIIAALLALGGQPLADVHVSLLLVGETVPFIRQALAFSGQPAYLAGQPITLVVPHSSTLDPVRRCRSPCRAPDRGCGSPPPFRTHLLRDPIPSEG